MGQLKNKLYWVAAFLLLLHWNRIIITGERLLTKLIECGLLKLFQAMIIVIGLFVVFFIVLAINEILIYSYDQNKCDRESNLSKMIGQALMLIVRLSQEINLWNKQEARQNSFLKLEKTTTHFKNYLIKVKAELAQLIRLRDKASVLDPTQLPRIQTSIAETKVLISALEQNLEWLELKKQHINQVADLENLNKEIEESEANVNRLFTPQTTWSNGNEDNRLIEDRTSHYMEWYIKSYDPRDLL